MLVAFGFEKPLEGGLPWLGLETPKNDICLVTLVLSRFPEVVSALGCLGFEGIWLSWEAFFSLICFRMDKLTGFLG